MFLLVIVKMVKHLTRFTEKEEGPPGLIAGMTGSGKSEFIITYILLWLLIFILRSSIRFD